MFGNILGTIISLFYILIIILIGSTCYKKRYFTNEDSRKFVHIGLSNWWLMAMLFFDSWIWASILPIIFIIINALNIKYNFIKGIERPPKKGTLGTVWYCVSLSVLAVVLFMHPEYRFIGAIAILILGYADGLGGIVTEYFGKTKLPFGYKTVEGTFTVFIVSFIISYFLLDIFAPSDLTLAYAFFISCFSTMFELFSIQGLDNITLPLGTAMVTYYLLVQPLFLKFAICFSIVGIIVFVAMINQILSYSGGLAALIVGNIVYYINGPYIFGLMLFFFLSSGLVEHYHKRSKDEKMRTWNNVFMVGLPFILYSFMYAITNSEIAVVCLLTSLAGATADTWGSAFGYFAKGKTYNIITMKPIKKGESGGVSYLGTIAGFIAAIIIGILSCILVPGPDVMTRTLIVIVFGIFTSYLDSVFGILLQVKYYNEKTGDLVETKPKSMKGYTKVSGYGFVTNEMVNFLTEMIASLLAGMLAFLIMGL